MVMMRRSEDGARCVRATERAALARGERSMSSAFGTLIYFRKSQTATWQSGGCNLINLAPAPGLVGANSPGGSRRACQESTDSFSSGSLRTKQNCAHSSSTILGPTGANSVRSSTRRTSCCGSRLAIASCVSSSDCASARPPPLSPSLPRLPSSARLRSTAASRSCSSCARRAASRSASVASAPHACTTSLPVVTVNEV